MKPQTALVTVVALLVVGSAVGVSAAAPAPDGSDGGLGPSLLTGLVGASGDVLATDDAPDDGNGTDVDGNDSIAVAPSDARETARAALSSPDEGTWVPTEFDVHEADGYYEFEYALNGSDDSGEAEVRVDGSSGDVIRVEIEGEDDLEEENETEDGDDLDDGNETDDGAGNASITVAPSDARETADAALGSPDEGTWVPTEFSTHEEDGYYEFEYALDGANASGEAEVRVDGSSGDVIRLEIEVEGDDEVETEDETEDDETEDETEDGE